MLVNMLRFSFLVVIVSTWVPLITPSSLWAGQSGSQLFGGTPTERSRLWDSSDFVHVVGTKRSSDKEDELAVTLRIDDGFHINANPASLPYLIPTSLALVGITPLRIAYPVASRFKPNFANEPLDVYEGTIVRERSVLAAGTILTGSTPVYDLVRGEIYQRGAGSPLEIPAGAVVVPGARAVQNDRGRNWGLSLYAAVIVKYRDEKTEAAVQLEDYLR